MLRNLLGVFFFLFQVLMQLYWFLRCMLLNKQDFVRMEQSKTEIPLDSPTSITGSINRKSLNHLNGKLRTKEKQECEVSHNLALKFPDFSLKVSGPFLNLRIAASF